MEQRGRKVSPIQLTDEELEHLGKLLRRRNLPNGEARRAKALMRMYEGANNKTIAEELGVCNHTVGIWRKRFAAERLQGISELPRSGAPRTIGDEKVQQVVTMTLEEKPEDATHWSTRSMAKRCGLSHDSVSRIWKAFGLA
ncbi:MAG: helix-turn-helix domain-containing protein, partial [Opitutales bacterium]